MVNVKDIAVISTSPAVFALKMVSLEDEEALFTPANWACCYVWKFNFINRLKRNCFSFKVSPCDKAAVIRAVGFIEAAFKFLSTPMAVMGIKSCGFSVGFTILEGF